jgi:hypothetical protein
MCHQHNRQVVNWSNDMHARINHPAQVAAAAVEQSHASLA